MTRTERTYYVVCALYNLGMWFLAPVYPLFLRSRGLDALEVNAVLATYFIVIFFFEVPTGAVADLFGRRFSFLLACLVRAAAFLLYYFADSFGDCLVAEAIDGIGTTLASGALDAWAVDGMRAEGSRRSTEHFFARAQVIVRATMIGGGLVCSWIALYDLEATWLVGAGLFVASFVVGLLVMHDAGESTPQERTTFWWTTRLAFVETRHEPVLLLVCLLTAAGFFAAVPAHMLWQAHFVSLSDQGLMVVGWIWVLLNLAALTGSALLPPLLARFRRDRVLAAAAVWRGLTLGLAAVATTFYPALAGWLLQEVGFGVTEPIMVAWLNERIPSERRATMLSVRSMFGTLGGGIGLIVIGLVARDHGIPPAWGLSAALLALMAPGYLLLGRAGGRPAASPVLEAARGEPEVAASKVVPPVG